MVNIEVGKELILENVLSLRKKLTQEEINSEMIIISKFLESNGISKNGSVITTTYGMDITSKGTVFDMEILIPIDKVFDMSCEYKLKPIFKLTNAIYARHEGNPAKLQNLYNYMMIYMKERNLQQITSGYNVTIRDIVPGMSVDDVIIDVYIGVSPNIL